MRAIFLPSFNVFLSGYGLVFLAALDVSVIFVLPGSSDIAVIILVARQRELFWLYPLLATAGSLAGSYVTYRMGVAIGEKGLERWVPAKQFKPLEKRIRNKGAIALAIPGLLPPPFPLTAFVLACGALKVRLSTFLFALGISRLVRYSAIAALSLLYGQHVATWLDLPLFKTAGYLLFVVALAGIAYSIFSILKTSRKRGRS
jgi:membrane protein YqaA with SNARE-associated domain